MKSTSLLNKAQGKRILKKLDQYFGLCYTQDGLAVSGSFISAAIQICDNGECIMNINTNYFGDAEIKRALGKRYSKLFS